MNNFYGGLTAAICCAAVGLSGACASDDESAGAARAGGAPSGNAFGGAPEGGHPQAGEANMLANGGQNAAQAGAPSAPAVGAGGLPSADGAGDTSGQAAAGSGMCSTGGAPPLDTNETCPAPSPCSPGEYVTSAADGTEAPHCAPCPPETYSDQANAESCTEWRRCRWSEAELGAATSSSDRTCLSRSSFWQFGTSELDLAYSVAVDTDGNVLAAGYTLGSLQNTSAGGEDAFVRKLDAEGAELWTQQFGTSADDVAAAIDTDLDGNIYVAGATSGNLDGTNAGTRDCFVRKLDTDGDELWTRQFGTNGDDLALSVAVDVASNVYVAGYLTTTPGSGGGTTDAFIRKLDGVGNVLWEVVFGTGADDLARAVAVDAAGGVYVAGRTTGSLASSNAGANDAFVRKLDAGGALQWTHQFGTGRDDEVNALGVDLAGGVYLGGTTLGSLQTPLQGEMDAFVRKLAATGAVEWTRQLGTQSTEIGLALAVDTTGNVFIGGYTDGSMEGSSAGGVDGFLREFDSAGSELGTYQFGTPENEFAHGLAVDEAGQLYAAGFTGGALQGPNAGAADALVLKFQVPPDEFP